MLKLLLSGLSCFLIMILKGQVPVLGIPKGHLAEVYSPDISSDGKYIVTPSADKTAKVWEFRTGRLLFSLEGHTKQVLFAKFTKDNKNIITAGDNSVIIWDALTEKKKYHLLHGEIPAIDFDNLAGQIIYSSSIATMAISADCKYMASGGTDSSIIIWEIKTGKKNHLLKHNSKLKSIGFVSDNQHLISLTENDFVSYWDYKNGKFIKQLIPEAKSVSTVSLSPDGKKLLTLTNTDASACVWDIVSGKMLHHLSADNRLMEVRWSPGGKKIIGAAKDQSFVWDAVTGKPEYQLAGHKGWVYNAVFSPSEKLIATSGRDLSIKIWNAVTKKMLYSLEGHKGMINSLSFSPDGRQLISTSDDHSVKFWDVASGQMTKQLSGAANEAFFGRISNDKKYFLTASADNTCIVWDMQGAKKIRSLAGHTSWIYFADFSKNNKLIITAATDNTARVWKLETGELLQVLNGHKDGVNHANFNLDATLVVTASEDKTAIVWDVANGKILHVLNHVQQVKTAEFSPDGKQILTTSFDRTAKIWDVESGKLIAVLKKHAGIIRAGEYSSDGKYIATASGDETAILWNGITGDYIRTLQGHRGFVYKASFGADNNFLYTASLDSTLKVWDISSGNLLHTLQLNGASVKSISSFNAETYILTSKDAIYHLNDSALNKRSSIFLKDSLSLVYRPDGNYMGDKEMVKILYYISGVKTLGYDQLDVKYNRPDKVLEAIGSTDTALIRSYRKAYEKRIKKLRIDTTSFRDGYSVPEADFVNRDAIEYEQKSGTLKLIIKGNDSTYKLDRFNVWVNESPIFGQRGFNIRKQNKSDFDTTITIKLSQGENRIETSITNANGTESYRMPLTVNYTPAVKQKETTRFIGIGIDRFADNQYNLQYSSKDIRDLSKKLKEKYKGNIIIDTLFNENVTAENVRALKQKLQQTSVNDKVIISYSGHGLLSDSLDYYLSTYKINFKKPEENGLPYDELENLLDSIPARKKLMLIDACHSGEVDKEEGIAQNRVADSLGLKKGIIIDQPEQTNHLGLKNSFELMQSLFVNVGKSTGATIISAAAGNQFALERGDLKNGVFTFSLLEVMNKYSTIKISELKKIVGERVEQLTNGMQKPTSRNEVIAADWSIW
jgi:WD40 repeat protein